MDVEVHQLDVHLCWMDPHVINIEMSISVDVNDEPLRHGWYPRLINNVQCITRGIPSMADRGSSFTSTLMDISMFITSMWIPSMDVEVHHLHPLH